MMGVRVLSKYRKALLGSENEGFFEFLSMNFKAGLQSGIPLCCILYHTFIYNSIYHLKFKNNRELIYLYKNIRIAIDNYHNNGSAGSCYIRCPRCLATGRYFKLLREKNDEENCHKTTWHKAITTHLNNRVRVK